MSSTLSAESSVKIDDLENKIVEVQKKVDPLWEVYEIEQLSQEQEKLFRSDPQMSVFYDTFKYKFHCALIGTKAVSSGFAARATGLKEEGLSFLIKGISGNIPFPGAALLGDIVDFAVRAYIDMNEMSKIATESRITSGSSASDFLSEAVARHVCRMYYEQIKRLNAPAIVELKKILGFTKKTRDQNTIELDKKAIVKLASCAVKRIFSFIVHEGKKQAKKSKRGMIDWVQPNEDEHFLSFPNRLALSLFHYQKKMKKMGWQNETIITLPVNRDKAVKKWTTKMGFIPWWARESSKGLTDEGIFQRSGVMVFDEITNPLMPVQSITDEQVREYCYWKGYEDRVDYYGYARLTVEEWAYLKAITKKRSVSEPQRRESRIRLEYLQT